MDELVLIAPPRSRGLRSALRRLSGGGFSWVYLGQSIAEFHLAKGILHGQGTYVDTTHRFHEIAESLREPYLKLLYRIGRDVNSLRWWITPLSYRSAYVSKTMYLACSLKLGLDMVNSWQHPGPLLLVAGEQLGRSLMRNLSQQAASRVEALSERRSYPLGLLRDTINMLAHRAYFLYQDTYRILQTRLMFPPTPIPREPTTLMVSWATPGNLQQSGEFHRSFFGDLAARLRTKGLNVVVVPMILREARFKAALSKLREASPPLLMPHRYLRFVDLTRAAISSLVKPSLPRSIPALADMDISLLLQEDLRGHWISNGAPNSLLLAATVRRWASLGCPIARIIYIYENQPWERALCHEVRRHVPDAILVGYLHVVVQNLLLNFFLAPEGEPEAPLPHRVVTVGRHTAQQLSGGGYAPGQVVLGGDLQGRSAVAADLLVDPNEDLGPIVLVATSGSRSESAELVELATKMVDPDDGVQVIIKCHPVLPFDRIERPSGSWLPEWVQVSEEPISQLMRRSSMMVYSGSTVCMEALAIGLPVIHLRTRFDFDLDALEDMPDLRLPATGLDELREKVRWLLANRSRYIDEHRDRWAQAVGQMYGPVTEATYRAFVENPV